MNNAGKFTHKARAVDPATFRNAATGIGQSFKESVLTGARRATNPETPAPAQTVATPVVVVGRK